MVPLIKLGVPPVMAATAVATFFSAISVVLLGNLYLTRLPPLLALSTLGASVLMPSFLFLSGMALSDTPYLALALVSLLCVINWTKTTRNQWFWVFTAGAFGGLAWCVRHVAVALLGTSCLFLAAHLLWRPLRVVAKALALWLLGWGATSSWLAYHNFNTFGRINPYWMGPSDLSLWDNISATYYLIVYDMSASDRITELLVRRYVMIGLLCFLLLALVFLIRTFTFEKVANYINKQRIELLFAIYIVFVVATTVVARTTYKWGEDINSRHYFQIYWAIWLLLSVSCLNVTGRFMYNKYYFQLAIIIIMISCSCLQIYRYYGYIERWTNEQETGERVENERMENAQILGNLIPRDKVVLSDSIKELRVAGDVNARQLPEQRDQNDPLTFSEIRNAGVEGFLWGIVIWDLDKCRSGRCGEAVQDILLHPERFTEFRQKQGWRQPLVLQFMAVH